jgi:hypothetical protein
MLANERVALEIKKDIAHRRFRKAGETEPDFERKEFVLAYARFAGLDLKTCLFTNPGVGFDRSPFRSPSQWDRQAGKTLDRCDPALSQFVDLNFGDPRNETEVVVVASALIAIDAPMAYFTMRSWLGIGGRVGFCRKS